MKTRACTLLLTSAVLVWCPSTASAQTIFASEASEPVVGDELAVTYFPDWLGPLANSYRRTVRLEFLGVEGRRLVGRVGGHNVSIETASIHTVKRRIGTKAASAPAMAMGSAAGFAAGFLIGAVSSDRPRAAGAQTAANRGLSTGVLVGAPLGALVAWVASRSRPIYEEVRLGRARPRVSLSLSGGTRFSISVPTR